MLKVLFDLVYKFPIFLSRRQTTVSSAKHMISAFTLILINPFIYSTNNIGPSPVSYSTPWLTNKGDSGYF